MKKRKTFVGMAIFLAVLVLGVGYAAVSGVELNLTGTANVKANADFSVLYDNTHTVALSTSDKVQWDDNTEYAVVAGAYDSNDQTKATMTVYLDSANRSAYAVYKIVNRSAELKATLTTEVSSQFEDTAANYLSASTELYSDEDCTVALGSTELAPSGVAYLKVTVELTKLPVEDIVNAGFNITVDATPVDAEL